MEFGFVFAVYFFDEDVFPGLFLVFVASVSAAEEVGECLHIFFADDFFIALDFVVFLSDGNFSQSSDNFHLFDRNDAFELMHIASDHELAQHLLRRMDGYLRVFVSNELSHQIGFFFDDG
jgi:hypothetical protein